LKELNRSKDHPAKPPLQRKLALRVPQPKGGEDDVLKNEPEGAKLDRLTLDEEPPMIHRLSDQIKLKIKLEEGQRDSSQRTSIQSSNPLKRQLLIR